ncbi:MAG TPA: NADH:flavin oxidoreductase [Deltaproteobacteria bacterium]|nr:NADH:flavin oxidoreductase [Candidatus Binatota bacterium]HIL12593.1 NADH:flavin oxidoreductase [Deltaproteobacteria bacterium]
MSDHPVLRPTRLAALELRNRVVKTATFEGMTPGGIPSDDLIEYHRRLAEGGVALTTVAYCAVAADGRTFSQQMYMRAEVQPQLTRLADAVHAEGGAVSIQLGHCGGFSKNLQMWPRRPKGPSPSVNQYGALSGMPLAGSMSLALIERTTADFAAAAARARDTGIDAVELHLGHGYLLSQFLSPLSNRRRDHYGGSLENRLRFPLEVVRAVREQVGRDYPVICKVNLEDGARGGLEIEEAVEVARALEREGVDALVLSGGFVARNGFYMLRGDAPIASMVEVEKNPLQKITLRWMGERVIRALPFTEMFFLEGSRRVREAVQMPLMLMGGIVSSANMQQAMDEGFDLVAVGRALIADPDFVRRVERGEAPVSDCNHCNECVAEMDRGGIRCVLRD